MQKIKEQLAKKLTQIFKVDIKATDFSAPPKTEMGDIAFPCFQISKELKKSPAEITNEILKSLDLDFIEKQELVGPYVNFFIKPNYLAKTVLKKQITRESENQKTSILLEFACPNTHKSFHIGHLRNTITGESICRILENAGHKITRANYQGDVGLHIAKALWGIEQLKSEYEIVKNKSLDEQVAFLGKAYAKGGQSFEKSEKTKKEVYEINEKIYSKDKSIQDVYHLTRKWSLAYFDKIYKRINTRFDRFYFESEVFENAKKIVLKFQKKKVFEESEGAIIFDGEKYGLHKRVFINGKGFPTYEAKDLALAELQFKENNPDKIIHVVGKEQTEYFKVIFKALEQTLPKSKKKEVHLAYGWVSLKKGKMSSRTGQVVLGEWLLDEIEKRISKEMKKTEVQDKEEVIKKVSLAAVKYAMLKIGIQVDMKFDIDESISLSGDSGPYLLYIYARINSILRKSNPSFDRSRGAIYPAFGGKVKELEFEKLEINNSEKALLIKLAEFEGITKISADNLDPSVIAKYLFDLGQTFNSFYHDSPVLEAEKKVQEFRLHLISKVAETMKKGLFLLGIETVEEM